MIDHLRIYHWAAFDNCAFRKGLGKPIDDCCVAGYNNFSRTVRMEARAFYGGFYLVRISSLFGEQPDSSYKVIAQ